MNKNNKYKLIIILLTIIVLWINYFNSQFYDLDKWRTYHITGQNFEQFPNFFKQVDDFYFQKFLIQEGLILLTGLLLLKIKIDKGQKS